MVEELLLCILLLYLEYYKLSLPIASVCWEPLLNEAFPKERQPSRSSENSGALHYISLIGVSTLHVGVINLSLNVYKLKCMYVLSGYVRNVYLYNSVSSIMANSTLQSS